MAPPRSEYRIKKMLRNAALAALRGIKEETSKTGLKLYQWQNLRSIVVAKWTDMQAANVDLASHIQTEEQMEEWTEISKEAALDYRGMLDTVDRAIEDAKEKPPPKLSEIKLAPFAGDWDEWVPWSANFRAKVLETSLSAGKKIDLLLEALKGQAKDTAGPMEHGDQEELQRMMDRLSQTYDNEYLQVHATIHKLMSMPAESTPSARYCRDLCNKIDLTIRSLSRYTVDEILSAVWCVLGLQKLGEESLKEWNTRFVKAEIPCHESLIEFLQTRARTLDDQDRGLEMKKGPKPNGVRPSETVSSQDNGDRKSSDKPTPHKSPAMCSLCNGPHWFGACEKYSQMTLVEREAYISKERRCFRCLNRYHRAIDCVRPATCHTCHSDAHHPTLCKEQVKKVNNN